MAIISGKCYPSLVGCVEEMEHDMCVGEDLVQLLVSRSRYTTMLEPIIRQENRTISVVDIIHKDISS